MSTASNITLSTPHDNCTGCSACQQACPAKAITMKMDDEGFIRPVVEIEKCIHCGVCNKVCPVADEKAAKPASGFLSAYAAWNKNPLELQQSSSGGIFSLLANRIIMRGGIVCGAIYSNAGHVHHGFAETQEQLVRMRGSKYVQSDMQDCFSRIRKHLMAGREVLFSGTGCQIGGLKSFLNKEYSNLLTLEIICEGTPSPGMWERHLHHVCPDLSEIHYLSFRDKTYGWTQTLVIDYTNKRGKRHKIAIPAAQEPYIKAMFAAISQARNCYTCRFREGRSGADIIIGDMWALRIVAPETQPKCGASVILCNTSCGAQVIKEIKQYMGYCKQISPLSATINNGYIYRAPVIDKSSRSYFFQNYRKKKQLQEYIEASLQRTNRIAILNHAGHSNYGSNLTAYALQEYLRRTGYDARVVSLRPFRSPNPYTIKPYLSFINGVIRWTSDVYGPHSCASLNKEFDTFIVGSDQVWRYPRPWIRRCAEASFYLDFAAQGKRRLAYAASFGINTYEGPDYLARRFNLALNDFDAVSVRETQGLDILREHFNYTNAVQVADPVFLLTRKDWQRFSQASEEKSMHDTLCYMFFFHHLSFTHYLKEYAENAKLHMLELSSNEASVMTWLHRLENAKLVVTDSFHTLCFALIFEKPFVVVTAEKFGKSRLFSLLQELGLTHRIIDTDTTTPDKIAQIFTEIASESIDYVPIRNHIALTAKRSGEWLKQSVSCPISHKKQIIQPTRWGSKIEKLPLFFYKLYAKLKTTKTRIEAKLINRLKVMLYK